MIEDSNGEGVFTDDFLDEAAFPTPISQENSNKSPSQHRSSTYSPPESFDNGNAASYDLIVDVNSILSDGLGDADPSNPDNSMDASLIHGQDQHYNGSDSENPNTND